MKSSAAWNLLLLPVLAFSLAAPALAGGATYQQKYQVETWQTDQGLPHDSVTALLQTSDGYLWLGTQNGLARFDGVRFKVFDENNTPAMKTSRIVRLLQDNAGSLWVATEKAGLVHLEDGQFTSFVHPGRGTTHDYARTLCAGGAGELWLTSCEWQLIHFEQNRFSVPSSEWHLSGPNVRAVVRDPAGQIWVGTDTELAVRRNGDFAPVWGRTNEENFEVESLAAGRTSGCWVAANGRVRKFQSGQPTVDMGAFAWTNRPIYDMYEDSRHCLWVATLGSGLFRYAPDGTVLNLTTRDGLSTDFVRCIIEDREGNLWVGTEGGGVCRLKPAMFQTIGTQQGLSSDQVMSVCESRDGGVWIGNNGDGLDYLKDGRVEHFGAEKGLKNGHIWSVLQDREGALWVGTWGGLFKGGDNGFTSLSDGQNIGWVVTAVYESSQGGLWLGQQAFGALTRLDAGKTTVVKIPGALASLDVRTIAEDRDGSLWVGTDEEGLYRRKDGQWTHFGKKDGLGSDAIWCLHVDKEGVLWVGTSRGGLSRWRNGEFRTWTTRDGLIDNVICQILEDDRGNLWLGSYGGVIRVGKEALDRYRPERGRPLRCVGYDKEDGLPSIHCQGGFQPSGWRSRDGRLWFPTVKGLAVVDPDAVTKNLVPPPVLIEGMVTDGKYQSLQPRKPAVAEAGAPRDRVQISPGMQRMEFSYTALSLTAAGKVRFKYRLEGFEKDWQSAGSRRNASYTHLSPGDYRFQVTACNNDGVWNETGASLSLVVLPYFWETKWFLGFATLAVLGALAGTVRYVEAKKLQRRIDLAERESAIERERARIAEDIHDDLGASLTEIALLSELAAHSDAPTEEVQTDLGKITTKARTLTRSLDEIVWAVNPQNDTLDSFVTYACSYAGDYLRVAKVACRLEVPERLPNIPLATKVRHNLFLVLKEALNNIVKHARAPEVWICLTLEPGRFTVIIRDNGRGFVPGAVAGATVAGAGEGHSQQSGLENMRKRIEEIGGHYELRSRPGEGTEIKVVVPLNLPGA